MMQSLMIYISVALAVGLGLLIHSDPGYVLIVYQNWSFESPLWLFILAAILFWVVTTSLSEMLDFVLNVVDRVKIFYQNIQIKRAKKLTQKGLMALVEGRHAVAEKYLVGSAKWLDTPYLNYLEAAKAAQALGAISRRDKYLELAYLGVGKGDLAHQLSIAKCQMQEGEWLCGLSSLTVLYDKYPHHPMILSCLKEIYQNLQDWVAMEKILPSLLKYNIVSSQEYLYLGTEIYTRLFEHSTESKDKSKLVQLWKSISKSLQSQEKILYAYAKALSVVSPEDAQVFIKKALKKAYADSLMDIYAHLPAPNLKETLSFGEGFISSNKENPKLFYALGQLCLKNQLWGKAKDYFEAALCLKPDPKIYYELAKLMEILQKDNESIVYYKKGLTLALKE